MKCNLIVAAIILHNRGDTCRTMTLRYTSHQILNLILLFFKLTLTDEHSVVDPFLCCRLYLLIRLAAGYIHGHTYAHIAHIFYNLLGFAIDAANKHNIHVSFRPDWRHKVVAI